jgi:hypothetical protein
VDERALDRESVVCSKNEQRDGNPILGIGWSRRFVDAANDWIVAAGFGGR